jgi:signal transduction histidine kinase
MMEWRRSLLARVLVWHGLATLVVAILAAASVAWLLDTTSTRLQHQTLDAYAKTIDKGLLLREGQWQLDSESRTSVRGGGSSFAFGVADSSGIKPIDGLPAPLITGGQTTVGQTKYFQRAVGSSQYVGVIWPSSQSPPRAIVVVQNLDDPTVFFDDANTRVALVAGLAIAALLAVLLLVDVIIVKRSLLPVARASQEIADLRSHDLTTRIATSGVPVEVMPLVEGANRAFERLATAYASQRDFHADAAHALRTPLAVLQLRADDITDAALRSAITAQILGLRRIVDGLLSLAEIDSAQPLEPVLVDLSALASDRVAEIAPLILAKGQTISVDAPNPQLVTTRPDSVIRALDAVLENAAIHTPRGTKIMVATGPAEIFVSDDGPGISYEIAEQIFLRFHRGKSVEDGSGLGLAIAERLMRTANGELTFENRPEGGSCFRLRFQDR